MQKLSGPSSKEIGEVSEVEAFIARDGGSVIGKSCAHSKARLQVPLFQILTLFPTSSSLQIICFRKIHNLNLHEQVETAFQIFADFNVCFKNKNALSYNSAVIILIFGGFFFWFLFTLIVQHLIQKHLINCRLKLFKKISLI